MYAMKMHEGKKRRSMNQTRSEQYFEFFDIRILNHSCWTESLRMSCPFLIWMRPICMNLLSSASLTWTTLYFAFCNSMIGNVIARSKHFERLNGPMVVVAIVVLLAVVGCLLKTLNKIQRKRNARFRIDRSIASKSSSAISARPRFAAGAGPRFRGGTLCLRSKWPEKWKEREIWRQPIVKEILESLHRTRENTMSSWMISNCRLRMSQNAHSLNLNNLKISQSVFLNAKSWNKNQL